MKIAVVNKTELNGLRAMARRNQRNGHLIAHLLDCYQTMFDNCCDPTADVLEFKPELSAAIADYSAPRLMKYAPRDGTPILAWHPLWNTWVGVLWEPRANLKQNCPWLTTAKDHTWPEEAFTHFRPMLAAPKEANND